MPRPPLAPTLLLILACAQQPSAGSALPPADSAGTRGNAGTSGRSGTTAASGVSNASAFATITFERTPCYGTCPVYQVRVAGGGEITFTGLRNVDSMGQHQGMLTASQVAALGRAFDQAGYWTLDERYGAGLPNCPLHGTDASSIITSIATAERTKRVTHDLGCGESVPRRLRDLYLKFDSIAGTARWIGTR